MGLIVSRRYFCGTERRRQAIADPAISLNGLDYLEVLDKDAPDQSRRQQTLLLRFFKPLPGPAEVGALTASNIEIEGGVRVKVIDIEWVSRASDADTLLAEGRIITDERNFLLNLSQPDHVLVLRTAWTGDFSPYRLCLAEPPMADGQPLYDPILSCVEFSFKVECPSDFDCQVDPVCPPEDVEEPDINYLAKDYASFRQLMLDRLAVVMPEWRERNPADLGIALVEVLAYAADHLSYYQDAVATEAYLGTARRRESVRRHARLLDYAMHDGCNARAWVQVKVEADNIDLPAGTPLLTRLAGLPARIKPNSDDETRAMAQRPLVLETKEAINLFSDHNKLSFYTWGETECCLPKGATAATLAGTRPNLQVGDVLILEEALDPGTGLAADADLTHRHAVRLSKVRVTEDPLFQTPVTEIAWLEADALPFSLCISIVMGGDVIVDMAIARGNIVLADHGRTVSEFLEEAPGTGRFRPRLQQKNVTQAEIFKQDQAKRQPAGALTAQNPRQALPAIELTQNGTTWRPRHDLLNSGRFEPHFVVETTNDGRASLRFGDGKTFGQRPPTGEDLLATYRTGNGAAGNVGAGAISHVVTDVDGVSGVHNPLPAQGGADPESLEEVRQYAPQAFRIQERAVTEADYVAVAQRHPEVQRAAATRRWTGSWHTMFITVDRKGGQPVDETFELELRAYLERFRLAGHDLEVDAPRFVPLDIAMTVCVAAGFFRDEVKRALLDIFSNRVLPDGRRGYFHPDNFTFGQPVYLSQVIAAVMDVPGVLWVDVDDDEGKPNRFRRFGEPPGAEIEQGMIAMGRLEIAQLDNDPSAPEKGRVKFYMKGGQ